MRKKNFLGQFLLQGWFLFSNSVNSHEQNIVWKDMKDPLHGGWQRHFKVPLLKKVDLYT